MKPLIRFAGAEASEEAILKNTKYIFLKNVRNLTTEQHKKRKELEMSKIKLKSMRALNIRESFQEIYNSQTKHEFESKLKKWYYWATHSRLEPIKKVAHSIKKHWNGVLQWFDSKINNGILEGINSIVQAAKARARGYKDTENYKAIAFLLAGDIDLSEINQHYNSLS